MIKLLSPYYSGRKFCYNYIESFVAAIAHLLMFGQAGSLIPRLSPHCTASNRKLGRALEQG